MGKNKKVAVVMLLTLGLGTMVLGTVISLWTPTKKASGVSHQNKSMVSQSKSADVNHMQNAHEKDQAVGENVLLVGETVSNLKAVIPASDTHNVTILKTFDDQRYLELDDGIVLEKEDSVPASKLDITETFKTPSRAEYYIYENRTSLKIADKPDHLDFKKVNKQATVVTNQYVGVNKSKKRGYWVSSMKLSQANVNSSMEGYINNCNQENSIHKEVIPGYELVGTNETYPMGTLSED